jgi:hypothetical protein
MLIRCVDYYSNYAMWGRQGSIFGKPTVVLLVREYEKVGTTGLEDCINKNFNNSNNNNVGVAVPFYTCIQEAAGSNLDQATVYHDSEFSWLLLSLPGKYRDCDLKYVTTVSFQIR